jgi:hypothetical protein
VAQAEKYLPIKCKTLSSNASTAKKPQKNLKKKKKKGWEREGEMRERKEKEILFCAIKLIQVIN